MNPGGTLAFRVAATGDTCIASQFHTGVDGEANVNWHDDGSLTIIMPDGAYQGRPCQTEPFTLLADYEPPQTDHLDQSFSVDGRFHIITTQTSSEDGILSYQTRLVETSNGQDRVTASWQIDQRLGDYAGWLGGEWVSPTQFLIYETLKQGPLLLDAEQGLISVLIDLLNQDAIPSILDETGVGMVARPIPGPDTNTYHLVVSGVGMEGNFPPVRLYHAEHNLVETLPYNRLYWRPFSGDGQWLFLNSSFDVDGYETVEIWMRRVEDMEGEWRLLASDVDGALWSPDETQMVNVTGETTVIWRTFPEGAEIGRWDTGPYWSFPISFSPDGRYVALGGNSPGQRGHVLFVLARPES
jgi:WD40 repeat protein